jgi:hypothetical protein
MKRRSTRDRGPGFASTLWTPSHAHASFHGNVGVEKARSYERSKSVIPFRYYLFGNLQHWTITYSMIAKGCERQRWQFSWDRER